MRLKTSLTFWIVAMSLISTYFMSIALLSDYIFFGMLGINHYTIRAVLTDPYLWAGLGFFSASWSGYFWRHGLK